MHVKQIAMYVLQEFYKSSEGCVHRFLLLEALQTTYIIISLVTVSISVVKTAFVPIQFCCKFSK